MTGRESELGAAKKRLILWNQYFPPDTSATSRLARELVEVFETAGWSVEVVAGNASYRPNSTLKWRGLALHQSTGRETRVRSTRFSRDRNVGRVTNYFSFMALSIGPMVFRRPDAVVVMTDPPILVIAAAIFGRLTGVPVIYWLQDFLPEFLTRTGLMNETAVTRAWSRLHVAAIKRTSSVVAIGRDMQARLEEAGVPVEKIQVVHNGSALDWDSVPFSATEKSPGSFAVVHAGEIGMRGAWSTIIEGFARCASNATMVFVGDGVDAPMVRERSMALKNVVVRAPVPALEVPAVLLAADALLVSVRRGAEGFTVPSKTYELFGAGKPIIVVSDPDTEPALLVSEIGCGLVVSPDDPSELADAVDRLAGDPALVSQLGAAALQAASRFRRKQTLSGLVAVANDVVATNSR